MVWVDLRLRAEVLTPLLPVAEASKDGDLGLQDHSAVKVLNSGHGVSEQSHAEAAMPPWLRFMDEDGDSYYFNAVSEQTCWELPPGDVCVDAPNMHPPVGVAGEGGQWPLTPPHTPRPTFSWDVKDPPGSSAQVRGPRST